MGGEGSMLHMINSLKSNKELRRSKRRKFRNANAWKKSKYSNQKWYPKLSEKELEKINRTIRKRQEKEDLKMRLVLFVIFLIPIAVLLKYWTEIFG